MKKTFNLTALNKKPDRQAESVKHDINKYVARERRKALPEGVDFWDFDCKLGATADAATVVHVSEIGKKIDSIAADKKENFYIEIIAKPGRRTKKESTTKSTDTETE